MLVYFVQLGAVCKARVIRGGYDVGEGNRSPLTSLAVI